MNRLKWLIIPFLFISCDIPMDGNNFVPVISIDQESQTIANGASITLTVDIDDQDDFYHYYVWTVNGNAMGFDESFTFSRTPLQDTDYIVGVTISDGEGLATDSIIITVLNPPWTPQPLHIYFFEVGTQQEEDTAVVEYVAIDNDQYNTFLSSTLTSLEIYNRDNDPDCYRVLGGTL